ncbi:hypothetical protein [Streptomyces werraensis]|uniref:hypothetical protein n=1 Tax=Streptomyces werraensis TaxID=68284 RepID=UPI0037FD760F
MFHFKNPEGMVDRQQNFFGVSRRTTVPSRAAASKPVDVKCKAKQNIDHTALEVTEAVTVLTYGFIPDGICNRAAGLFLEAELARLIAAIQVNNLRITVRPVDEDAGDYVTAQH